MKDMKEGDTRTVSKPCWQCKSKEQKVVKFGSGKRTKLDWLCVNNCGPQGQVNFFSF